MGKGRGPKDPFGTYREWSEHRLNPGHYLGGTIEPHLRKSELGPRARRLSGIMLVLSGGTGLLSLLSLELTSTGDTSAGFRYLAILLSVGLLVLFVWAGVTMFRPNSRKSRKPRPR